LGRFRKPAGQSWWRRIVKPIRVWGVNTLSLAAIFVLAALVIILFGVFKIAPDSFKCRATILRLFSFEMEVKKRRH
jgi:hypothetical protein